ncbi:MAG TPA: SIR2 family protein [Candidatus Baltobacteraceae bacterium]|jgi:hypothetical protein|nr:SIR2 family protein [Candidatus Baltobacteraceae bacterium]
MIKKPTVLVVGAGASYPYGYPVGHTLVDDIIKGATDPLSALFHDLTHVDGYDFDGNEVKKFARELNGSASQSVDAFLESRPDFSDMGRCAIASELMRYEKPGIIHATNEWYQYLFQQMYDRRQFESFGESKVSIITFNYDRSLEFCLFTAMRKSSLKSHAECVINFERIKIIHVHGRLGPSPIEEHEWPPYGGSPITPVDLSRLARQITIIHEAQDDTPEFESARSVLSQAERICFIGFGFHETNLRRLFKGVMTVRDPTQTPNSTPWSLLSGVKIFGHNYEFTDSEKVNIQRFLPLPTCDWGDRKQGCKEFLREKGVLFG